MRHASIALFVSLVSFGGLTYPTVSLASQVTTERIISLPTYSASSQDNPAQLDPYGEGSATSGGQIDGMDVGDNPALPIENTENQASFSGPLPPVLRDLSNLPLPVRQMHNALYKAAIGGNLGAIRSVAEMNEMPPIIGLEGESGDPVDIIRQMSGDESGAEILAILSEILESGFVHVGEGTPQDMYIWPYFAAYPLNSLTAAQRVELFRLITAGDYEEMDAIGHYAFFRLGIGPDGTWHYFTAGE